MPPAVLTITLNPAVDAASEAEIVRPIHKIRTTAQLFDPGGGGINVARVIAKLGGSVEALYMAGGATGALLGELLAREGLNSNLVPIAGTTRIAFNIFERQTGFEYRFVPEGPKVTEKELTACLDRLKAFKGGYVVASGSVPDGIPETILTEMAAIAAANGARFVVDSSGAPLRHVLAHGPVHLVKPSLGELQQVSGKKLDEAAARDAALALVEKGTCDMVAVTLGAQGAILASAEGVIRVPAIHVATHSAVGAGDSFLGAMVWALGEGWSRERAFRLAVAAGAATAQTPGTALCEREDIFRLFENAGS